MISIIGGIAFILVIYGLFRLDKDDAKMSNAIWISFFWLLIASSRPISSWITLSVPGTSNDSYIDGSPLDRNALTFLMFLALFILSKRMRQIKSILRANRPLVFYFLYCLISMLWSDYPFVVFKRWTRSIGDVAIVLVLITDINWLAAFQRVFTRIAFILIPLSIVFIRFFPQWGRAYSIGGAVEWTGVNTDKNALGAICMLYGVALLWRFIAEFWDRRSKYRKRRLFAFGAVLVMILYLLAVVDSQTALACFGLSSIFLVLSAYSRVFRKPVVAGTMISSMYLACFCILFLGLGSGALTTIGRNGSLTGRTQVWQTVLPYAVSPMFGAGYENFWIGDRVKLFNRLLGGLNQAHNGYIEIYLNLGWVGLALLTGVILSGFRSILRGLRTEPDVSRLRMVFFFICIVYNFTEASFKMMSPVWMLFLWAVIAVPNRSRAKATVQSADSKKLPDAEKNGTKPHVRVPAFDTTTA